MSRTEKAVEKIERAEAATAVTVSPVLTLNREEIDVQIASAKKYPRSVTHARQEAESMATMDADTAASCFYKLPRKDRDSGETRWIEGPSIRLMEIFACAWGNIRMGAYVIEERERTVVARGFAHDLQANVAAQQDVQRRIVDRAGRRYSDDMIMQTSNAAASIALRNALIRVIPRAYVDDVCEKCKKVAVGDSKTLAERRLALLDYFKQKHGVDHERILRRVERSNVKDIDLTDMEKLHGIATAIRENQLTVDEAFPAPVQAAADAGGKATEKAVEKLGGKQ